MWGKKPIMVYFSIRGLEKFHSLHALEYISLPLFRINLCHWQKSLPFLNRLSLGADVIMSKTALEPILMAKLQNPINIYWICRWDLLFINKNEQPNLVAHFMVLCQQVYHSLLLSLCLYSQPSP